MALFANVKVKNKVILMVLVLQGFSALVVITAFLMNYRGQMVIRELLTHDIQLVKLGGRLKTLLSQHRRYEKEVFLSRDAPRKQRAALDRFRGVSREMTSGLEGLFNRVMEGSNRYTIDMTTDIEAAQSAYQLYSAVTMKQLTQAIEKRTLPGRAHRAMEPYSEYITDFENRIGDVVKMTEKHMNARRTAIEALSRRTAYIMLVVGGIGLVLSIVLLVYLYRLPRRHFDGVIRRLRDLGEGDGDLTQRIRIDTKDEFGEMAGLINGFLENIRGMVEEIVAGADRLRKQAASLNERASVMQQSVASMQQKSGQLAQSLDDLNSRFHSVSVSTEETTANIQSISSAAEELSVTFRDVSQNASQTQKSTEGVVLKMNAMGEKSAQLRGLSDEVSSVIASVNSISEQINLLALNATIEAVQAGDAGHGFAVVADEVKSLSTQTGSFANQVNERMREINTAMEAVSTGVRSTHEVMSTVEGYVRSTATAVGQQTGVVQDVSRNIAEAGSAVSDVSRQMHESADMLQNQTSAVSSLDQSIGDIQQTAGGVSDVSSELDKLSRELADKVSRFTI